MKHSSSSITIKFLKNSDIKIDKNYLTHKQISKNLNLSCVYTRSILLDLTENNKIKRIYRTINGHGMYLYYWPEVKRVLNTK